MAGRSISGDFISHASFRVTDNAAVAAKHKTTPHDVPWSEVRPVIEKRRSRG